ncbi:MAG: protein phosphatase 2C domain-containing protein [Spirochaetaceae bacterium]|nr:protein phosphatase 2C domain-containing protein [Spirochaetaceae bacterium]
MALALRYAARSDTGLIRAINEDSGYAGPRLLIVADGVGGHAAGEVASSVAVASLAVLDEDSPGGDLLGRLSAAVSTANKHLSDMVLGDPDLGGMGTTLTAMLRAGSRFGLVHVGDSRCYLLRGDDLQQITKDHTFVQSLVDEGRITAEEADNHPQRNLITNSLDGRADIELDLSVRETRAGDRYLLCSDGLSGVVSEETLRETLMRETDTDVAVESLVELALKGGGPDNITAIVADVVEVETKPPSAVPVTVGAAAEGVVQRSPSDTPAGKAAALRPPADEPVEADGHDDYHRGGRVRRVVLALLLLALLGGSAVGAYLWSRTQYYVGAQDQKVAIFQGLTQDVGPLRTSDLYEKVDVSLSDLPAFQRVRVQDDIATSGLADAQRIVANLREQAEICQEAAAAAPTPTPTPSPSATPSPSTSAGADAGSSPSASPSASEIPAPTANDPAAIDCGQAP